MSTRLDFSRLTLMDALDLASLIELEARRRYTELAESLGTRGVDDAGAVFRGGERESGSSSRHSSVSPVS